MKKRIFALVLALVMALGLTVTAAADETVTYLDADGTTKTCTDYTTVTSETGELDIHNRLNWGTGWYIVNSDVTINKRVNIAGDVKLILCDDAKLTVEGNDTGIFVDTNFSLTVYGQTSGTGSLSAGLRDGGPGAIYNQGTLTINGGVVTATGKNGAGIYNYDGTLTITGGVITATVESSDIDIDRAGISSSGGSVTITGGTVKATGNKAMILRNGATLTLTDCYKWRTADGDPYTTNTCRNPYTPDSETQVEIVTPGEATEQDHTFGNRDEGTAATCTADGTVGHKTCSVCNKHFDANGVEITNLTIPATGHASPLTRIPARDATRQEAGNIEYWQCSNCGQCFKDEDGQTPIAQEDTVIAKLPPQKNNSAPTPTETVASPKTADPGVLLTAALSVASLLGMGYVGKKR